MRFMNYRGVAAGLVAVLLSGLTVAGSVTGTVKYDGTAPKMRQIRMDADPACAKKHASPALSEMLVMGDGNTMGNVFVRVKSGVPKKEYPAPKEPVVIDQVGCRYTPHVLGVMAGQPLKILNSDGLLHNIHALPKVNKSFNMAMPATRKEADATFTKEEFMFKIKCDVHPWMGAWIAVMTHPFFDVTATDGKFDLGNLPPGTYEIEAWHEHQRLGTKTASVTISGDESQTVDFTYSGPSK